MKGIIFSNNRIIYNSTKITINESISLQIFNFSLHLNLKSFRICVIYFYFVSSYINPKNFPSSFALFLIKFFDTFLAVHPRINSFVEISFRLL